MHVVVACDSFGGRLSAPDAAAAIATGWASERPDDAITVLPLSDGGEGLIEVLRRPDDELLAVEVAGPRGLPVAATLLVRPDGTVVVESAQACGLHLLAPERRDPLLTTTYGVGQLLGAAQALEPPRIVVGLGGSATVDGGAGALSGLGFRLTVADGSGLKVGGRDLERVTGADRGWAPGFDGIEVTALADVTTRLRDCARIFGPQKGAGPEAVGALERGLDRWAEVAERDLAGGARLRELVGSGAAGGLGFGLGAGLGARIEPGAAWVADLLGLDAALAGADLVVTGEGRLDATTAEGKVVSHVLRAAAVRGVPVQAVVGVVAEGVGAASLGLQAVEQAPADDAETARAAAADAARRLAAAVAPA